MSLSALFKKSLKYFDLDVSFSCPAGKTVVMIGPSGGGKTTVIRMLAGLETPDEGILRFGNEIWFDSERRVNVKPQKRRLGYVFQDYNLFPHLNLYDNAAFAAVDKKEVDSLFELFGISHLKKRKPHMVSGGERQRCAICQALARHPRVLLLDEPFSALDVVTRRGLREQIKNLKGRLSCPVVYVTHDINEALYLADEIMPLVEGKIDEGWMQRTISREPGQTAAARGAREPRLSLVY
jgi:molybdate transport system ATP-binding protein